MKNHLTEAWPTALDAGKGSVPTLYLDFDGVLHPAAVQLSKAEGSESVEAVFAAPGHSLFENAALLTELLAPHPLVRLVLSTSWVFLFGYEMAAASLPLALQKRLIGATFDPDRDSVHFTSMPRGHQVVADVKRRGLKSWVALDDDGRDWPRGHKRRLIATDPHKGLTPLAVRSALARWLESTAQ